MMINSLAAFIQYLKTPSLLSTPQIAEKPRYGEAWAAKSRSIVVRLDGGTPDLDLPVQPLRLEVRCFAEDAYHATELINEVISLSRTTARQPVILGSDTALIYEFWQESGPSLLFDDDLNMDFALMFFGANISE
jgi:hypothetical protein